MANNPLPYDTPVQSALNTYLANLNNGFIKIYTGAQPSLNGAVTGTLLVSMTFGSTAFANASSSLGITSAPANAITYGVAVSGGTAGYFALVKSDNSTVVGTGSVGLSGADLNMSNLSVTANGTVSCSSFTVTWPQN